MTALIISLALFAGAFGTASRAADAERQGAPSLASLSPSASGRAAALALRAATMRARLASPFAADKLTTTPSSFVSFHPLLFQAGEETVETFEGTCTTPKSNFELGDTVCAKVSGEPEDAGRVLRRLVFAHPDGFVIHSVDVSSANSSYTFTLPEDAETGLGDSQLDNRGTWVVATVDTDEAGLRALAPIAVSDPAGAVADLQITKVEQTGRPVAGQNFSYLINVHNLGPDAAANVAFTDHPPANTTFVSFAQNSGPAFTCTTTSGQTECEGASLARGQSAIFTATYLVNSSIPDGAEISDTVTVESDTTERSDIDNSSTASDTADNPTPPSCTLGCPGSISQEAAPGATSAVVTFDAPTVGGNCGTGPTQVSPASGSAFPLGTTTVTATTPNGQTCNFTVTVTAPADDTPPSINCPGDITVPETSASADSAPVTFSVTATDNNPGVSVTCTANSGASFEVGTTPVSCTATDLAGNTTSCDFNIVVTPVGCNLTSAPPTPNVGTLPTRTGACSVTILATDAPRATDNCGGTIIGTTTDPLTYNTPGDHTITWTYTDAANNTTTQTQTVSIAPDNVAPVPDVATLPTVTGECSATITGPPPTATDNCAGSDIEGTPLDPLTYNTPGTHIVRWQFTDNANNSSIQNQTVIVTDGAAPVPNVASLPTVTAECSATVTTIPTATDACAGQVTATTNDPLTYTTQGTHTIHWTYTDAAGNTSTQNQTVVIDDNTPPTLALPNVTVSLPLNSSATSMAVNYPAPTTSDNCGGAVSVVYTPASGSVFSVGTTTVSATATDAAGNSTTGTFTVTVLFNFTGFFSPVNNLPTINQVNAGRAIPVKFSLSGNKGLGVFAAGSPSSGAFACGTSDPVVDMSGTIEASENSFSYSASGDQYNFVWKTESAWAGTCRQLVLTLTDGTTHRANFKFK
ncbi:MAG TPA: HYR domain-containing protein [Pyrinomonadaceae bacterium]|nr:HYR domain-containing protein [Pyrinomonadaceae bacterium]